MKCPVCLATWGDQRTTCPQCGYDQAKDGALEPDAILKARDAFRAKTTAYAPESRVTTLDKLKPWLGLALGFVLFMFWLRACSTMGWRIF